MRARMLNPSGVGQVGRPGYKGYSRIMAGDSSFSFARGACGVVCFAVCSVQRADDAGPC